MDLAKGISCNSSQKVRFYFSPPRKNPRFYYNAKLCVGLGGFDDILESSFVDEAQKKSIFGNLTVLARFSHTVLRAMDLSSIKSVVCVSVLDAYPAARIWARREALNSVRIGKE